MDGLEALKIRCVSKQPVGGGRSQTAFTLVELLVAISIISILMAITIPAFQGIHRKAINIYGMNNLREIARGVNAFSMDNKDRYPPSVGTVGYGDNWRWEEPRILVASQKRSATMHRSMSAYLYEYINNAEMLQCPGAPYKQEYLREVWEAGDEWYLTGNLESLYIFTGTYCFYWNYMGLTSPEINATEPGIVFKGPWGPASGRKYSKIMAGDFFNFGNGSYPPPNYGTCERFSGADIIDDHDISPSFWTTLGTNKADIKPSVQLKSVFIDEHVETNNSLDAVPLWVIFDRVRLTPRDVMDTTGIFYIPDTALPVER